MGFPEPKSVSEVNYFDEAYTTENELEYAYSIGELMEFLPKYNVSIHFPVDGIDDNYFISCSKTDGCSKELIDALYNACVELKNG